MSQEKSKTFLAMRLDVHNPDNPAILKKYKDRHVWEVRMEVLGYVEGEEQRVKDELTFRTTERCKLKTLLPVVHGYINQITEPFHEVHDGSVEVYRVQLSVSERQRLENLVIHNALVRKLQQVEAATS